MFNRLRSASPVVFALGFALLWGIPSLLYPFGHDQGMDAYIADLVMRGALLYEDVYHVKPPGTLFIYMLSETLFDFPAGYEMVAIRLLDILWQAATAFFIYKISLHIFKHPHQSVFAAVTFIILYYVKDFWHSTNTDGFLNLPIAIAIFTLLNGEKRSTSINSLFVGFWIGIAFLIKYPIGIMLAVCGTLYLFGLKRKSWVAVLFRICLLAVGFIFPIAGFFVYLNYSGTLDGFLDFQSNYFSSYNGGFGSQWDNLRLLYWQFIAWVVVTGIGASSFILLVLRPIHLIMQARGDAQGYSMTQLLPLIWLLGSLVHLGVQNKFYDYHSYPIIAPLSLLISQELVYLFSNRSQKLKQVVTVFGLCSLIIVSLLTDGNRFSLLGRVLFTPATIKDVYVTDDLFVARGYSARGMLESAAWLEVNTQPQDQVLVWAFEPSIYYLSERDSSSRIVYNFPLIGKLARPVLLETFYQDLRDNPPAAILVAVDDAIPHVTGTNNDSFEELQTMPELASLLESGYEFIRQIDHYLIYDKIDG
ncbi:MAG: glycosyltransferase family 39 protein [Chloroflexota bacterium]